MYPPKTQVLDAFAPNIIPTVAAPFIESFSNRSLFMNRQIIPEAKKGLLPQYQSTAHGTELAKFISAQVAKVPGLGGLPAVGKMIASPALLENTVRGWGGGAGMTALGLADKAAQGLGLVAPPPVRPAKTLADIPVVKGFVLRYPSSNTENVQAFYDTHDSLSKLRNSYMDLLKQGKAKEAEKLLKDNGGLLLNTSSMRSSLLKMSKFADMIYQDKLMSPEQKRQKIDDIYRQMDQMAIRFNDSIKRLQEGKAAGK
ncbi:LPD38 domain-containing protein [Candidatus Magnetobacterium casense]|uniref:Large polyvalent protein associated domain-containing protein n=1 Tax=Candidatus Magnetobacterium casense TaxID=1455061 RepID=A0ABS6S533_9BACT|nr:LPD38 domain-containing protein [Candidatus Magnetobacterium casensis]MBV6343608.1 hypothetical protein [Candidatus Magnetobacterium casensis]